MVLKSKKLVRIISFLICMILITVSFGCSKQGEGVSKTDQTAAEQKLTVVDDVGRSIELDKPLSRVVVFNQMNCEIIRALGKADTIAGTDANTLQSPAYWPQIDPKSIAGKSQTALDYEKIAQIKPEAVILPKTDPMKRQSASYRPLGLRLLS